MTKQDALNAHYGDIWHHVSEKNADGTPKRARVTGACKTWKRDPDRWYLPMKYGMRDTFRLGPDGNARTPASEWQPGDGID